MASFRKRAGRWQARVNRPDAAPIVKTFDLKVDAERWAIAIQRELDLGQYAPKNQAESILVSDAIARYAAEVVARFKGAEREKYALQQLCSMLGDRKINRLSAREVAEYRDKRSQMVSGSTVLRELNSLGAMLNHARKEWGLDVTNVVAQIRKPKPSPGRTRRLEGDEEARLLVALEAQGRECNGQLRGGTRNPWVKPVFKFALATAMRRSEILALQWVDVNLDKRIAFLPTSKNGFSREIPLSSTACELLRSLPRSISGRVFPITVEAFKQAFTRACKAAEVLDFRFHDCRHEAASRLAERLNVLELAAVTGHRDLRMLQRYVHIKAEALAQKLG